MDQWKSVSIGTGSVIKITALETALGGKIAVQPFTEAASGVPPQPIGVTETATGGKNRAQQAKDKFPDADAWFGIENGYWAITNKEEAILDEQNPEHKARGIQREVTLPGYDFKASNQLTCLNEDAAAIVVLLNMGKPHNQELAAKLAAQTKNRGSGFQLMSDSLISAEKGEFIGWSPVLSIPIERSFPKGPNQEWSELKDPHDVLTLGTWPRKKYLLEGLTQLLASLKV